MKLLKLIIISIIGISTISVTVIISKNIIEKINANYVPENPVVEESVEEKNGPNPSPPQDIDRLISHGMNGTGETELPVTVEDNYKVYSDKLFVTMNQGETWLEVPDDDEIGYARISDYIDNISPTHITQFDNKISIVYGGRGSENISIISTETNGEYWSVSSISKTASHDLKNGYDQIYIDFRDDDERGYIAAIRHKGTTQEEILAFRSVNTGVTWDPIGNNDQIYSEILAHFGL
ncbi:hypothetical protein [Radiobacillus sp. PE A8.2]|uniref:hypothetical protein n=1 Tax=Radiobacillus sp. PE A8.2 TaxID=3380349 RepID=UPI00388EBF14